MTDILKRAGMTDCKPLATPIASSWPLFHMHAPTTAHWEQLKRVLRYVKGTLSLGLRLGKSDSGDLHAFSDSYWACCPADRKSTSGFAVFLGTNLVSWVCKK
ncbi:uncharacterized protein LOC116010730 [Ipomoea triloba]|uniref:uncharacterized protein LOC116010730 n=1 Tax=Ipomoea triloba TaxID=35885 RepID=UPI00125DE820|nr:uncharacterized protein LOC116010730 [Ipomoea triloba]